VNSREGVKVFYLCLCCSNAIVSDCFVTFVEITKVHASILVAVPPDMCPSAHWGEREQHPPSGCRSWWTAGRFGFDLSSLRRRGRC